MTDFTTFMYLAIERLKAQARHVAKALVAVATPVLVEGAFQALESFDVATTPAPVRLVIAALVTGLAVYRKKNGLKP